MIKRWLEDPKRSLKEVAFQESSPSHSSLCYVSYCFTFSSRLLQVDILIRRGSIRYVMKTLSSIAAFILLTGCSNATEEIEELGEKYGLTLVVMEDTLLGSDDMVELDYDEAEELMQYIRQSLDEGPQQGDGDVAIEPKLKEPISEAGDSSTHTSYLDEHLPDLERSVQFNYTLQQGAESITPTTIELSELHSSASGLPGVNWVHVNTSASFDDNTEEVSFYTSGNWEVHFLYEGNEVWMEVPDDWIVPLQSEELLEEGRHSL
ncbi:hypothetical protein JCM19055_3294 [Geomicrobium sp. JCM 19055]|nr:hypothetical protein JCM19055_3294 [Geomicrobium sp. JCM 19055]